MGLLRPSRKVTSPSGEDWELYVSKTALPGWHASDGDDTRFAHVRPTYGFADLPFTFLLFLWASVLVPLAGVLVLLPVAVVRGRRSRAVRVEAVTSFPQRQVLLWTTTDAHVRRVVDEIADGLAKGKIVSPDGAVYTGPES